MIRNQLRQVRIALDISRRELADAVGINVQTLGFIERGDSGLSLRLALRICQHLNVRLETVFTLDDFLEPADNLSRFSKRAPRDVEPARRAG